MDVLTKEFAGWPILNSKIKNISILQRMITLRKIGFKTLIDFHVTLNPKDPQYLILKVN